MDFHKNTSTWEHIISTKRTKRRASQLRQLYYRKRCSALSHLPREPDALVWYLGIRGAAAVEAPEYCRIGESQRGKRVSEKLFFCVKTFRRSSREKPGVLVWGSGANKRSTTSPQKQGLQLILGRPGLSIQPLNVTIKAARSSQDCPQHPLNIHLTENISLPLGKWTWTPPRQVKTTTLLMHNTNMVDESKRLGQEEDSLIFQILHINILLTCNLCIVELLSRQSDFVDFVLTDLIFFSPHCFYSTDWAVRKSWYSELCWH